MYPLVMHVMYLLWAACDRATVFLHRAAHLAGRAPESAVLGGEGGIEWRPQRALVDIIIDRVRVVQLRRNTTFKPRFLTHNQGHSHITTS